MLERRDVQQAVLALLHVLDAAGGAHQVNVLEGLPLRAASQDVEQGRGLAAAHADDDACVRFALTAAR